MEKTKTTEIWEAGNQEEILKLKEHLRKIDNGRFLIIHRKTGDAWDRYLRHHTAAEGFELHPIHYEWDGYVYALEFLA